MQVNVVAQPLQSGHRHQQQQQQQQQQSNQMSNNNDRNRNNYNNSNSNQSASKTTKTTTTTTTTIVTKKQQPVEVINQQQQQVATVEQLGKQANHHLLSNQRSLQRRAPLSKPEPDFDEIPQQQQQQQVQGEKSNQQGNKFVTTIGTLAAQSGQSRIVLALLRSGQTLQLQVQEQVPGFLQVGTNYRESLRYLEEQQKLISNLRKQRKTPIDGWMEKFEQVKRQEPQMSPKRKLVFLCMAENLQTCWKALLSQLEQRSHLLDLTCSFYEACEQLSLALDRADQQVALISKQFLDNNNNQKNSLISSEQQFNQMSNELNSLNQLIGQKWDEAKRRQRELMQLVAHLGESNSGDSRPNHLLREAQQLNAYLAAYLLPLEQRRLKLEQSIVTVTSQTTKTTTTTTTNRNSLINSTLPDSSDNKQQPVQIPTGGGSMTRINIREKSNSETGSEQQVTNKYSTTLINEPPPPPTSEQPVDSRHYQQQQVVIREITNFNDLNLVDNWLRSKIEQLNSNYLSSLGVTLTDSRSILNKHEQIALECRAIEEATLMFNGKSIHAIKPSGTGTGTGDEQTTTGTTGGSNSLLERQRALAQRAREVITILEARIVLLRRTIDFYQRSKEATGDIGTMMRRLQVDNSLQSVQFVANELELKDVSSVVASGATIISELQQLQLAQQHGQRSRVINLNLITSGIRAIIDQLNQDLAHLKTVLNQRRLVLLNEDASKMAQNFANKCSQLQFWLQNNAKNYLLTHNNALLQEEQNSTSGPVEQQQKSTAHQQQQVRAYCDGHQQLRVALQNKTLEVEALLRSLPTLSEQLINATSGDKSRSVVDEIQQSTDELRQDWITTTNCLNRRIELAQKYLLILNQVNELERELAALEGQQLGNNGEIISTAGNERPVEDIRSNVDHSLIQLTNQVDRFREFVAKKEQEQQLHPDQQVVLGVSGDDDNGKYLSNQAEHLLRQLNNRKAEVLKQMNNDNKGQKNNAQHNQQQQQQQQQQPPPTPAHQRSQQVLPPRFTRPLVDQQAVEPFSSVELECETAPPVAGEPEVQVEWFMNNMKRIPSAVKHIASSENNHHKLLISSFTPTCCGTYQVRASNSAGQVISQCRLRLAGIQESVDESTTQQVAINSAAEPKQQVVPVIKEPFYNSQRRQMSSSSSNNQQVGSSPSSNSFSHWRPANATSQQVVTTTTTTTNSVNNQQVQQSTEPNNQTGGLNKTIARVIQGVESSCEPESPANSPLRQSGVKISQLTTSDSDADTTDNRSPFPVTQTTYSGTRLTGDNKFLHPAVGNYQIASPISSTTTGARSISKSPFEGTPQPPVFVQSLADSIPHCCSRAGLVALVVGNPPPTIEWLHNDQLIATARCPPRNGATGARGSLCKLTIETMNKRTEGDYVCRASNRLGQTASGVSILKS